MAQKTHKLKTWRAVFQALWDGRKTAEFRKDDRDFQVNDSLNLLEFDPVNQSYSGRIVVARISHIVRGGRFGFPEGYVMLSLADTARGGTHDGQ